MSLQSVPADVSQRMTGEAAEAAAVRGQTCSCAHSCELLAALAAAVTAAAAAAAAAAARVVGAAAAAPCGAGAEGFAERWAAPARAGKFESPAFGATSPLRGRLL